MQLLFLTAGQGKTTPVENVLRRHCLKICFIDSGLSEILSPDALHSVDSNGMNKLSLSEQADTVRVLIRIDIQRTHSLTVIKKDFNDRDVQQNPHSESFAGLAESGMQLR